jgi:hypothetical protein
MQKDHSEGHWTQGKEATHHSEGRGKERRLQPAACSKETTFPAERRRTRPVEQSDSTQIIDKGNGSLEIGEGTSNKVEQREMYGRNHTSNTTRLVDGGEERGRKGARACRGSAHTQSQRK